MTLDINNIGNNNKKIDKIDKFLRILYFNIFLFRCINNDVIDIENKIYNNTNTKNIYKL